MKFLVPVLLALALTACGGEESNQPPQTPPARLESTGIIVSGESVGPNTGAQTILAKGAVGVARSTSTSADGRFTLSMTDLGAPFLFGNSRSPTGDPSFVFMTSIATRVGHVNVTPLTTLLTAQLFGVDPVNAYTNFGAPGNNLVGQVSDAALLQAQADLTLYLQDVLGIQVKSGTASFVDATFTPTAGDSMYDTIQALNAKLAADGTKLMDVAKQVAFSVQACKTESIQITVDGVRKAFCPVIKGGVPREDDITIIDYVFKNIPNDVLTLKVQGDSVLGAAFTPAGGATFQCSAPDCGSISLGTPAADLSRSITFASTALMGTGSSALIDGTLVGPEPSITLPLLPCTDNRYYVIFDNHDVVADCVDTANPIPVSGTFSMASGPDRDVFRFGNSSNPLPNGPHLEVVTQNGPSGPTVVSVFYQDRDPATSQVANRFVCRQAACNGVTFGPVTINTAMGFPMAVRTITLDNTVLTGLNADGTTTGTSVQVRGSFTTVRDGTVGAYPPSMPCDPSADTIAVEAHQASFNYCLPQNDLMGSIYRSVMDLGDGRSQISFTNDMFSDTMGITFDNTTGAVLEAWVQISSSYEEFRCTADCVGIAISAPNGAGERTVKFTDAVIHHQESYPLPGDRTLKLNSSAMRVPPP